jgi:hypothetical protein
MAFSCNDGGGANMIIWQGAGILVVVIAGLSFVLMQLLTDALFGKHYFVEEAWPKIVAALVAGAIIWMVGLWLNKRPGRLYLDVETHEHVEFKPRHTLFFVNMEYWGPLIVIFTLISILVEKAKAGG